MVGRDGGYAFGGVLGCGGIGGIGGIGGVLGEHCDWALLIEVD